MRQTYFWSILGGNRSGLMDEFLTGCKFNLLLPPTMSAQPQDFMDVGVHTSEIWREVLVNVVVSVHIGSCTTKTTARTFQNSYLLSGLLWRARQLGLEKKSQKIQKIILEKVVCIAFVFPIYWFWRLNCCLFKGYWLKSNHSRK